MTRGPEGVRIIRPDGTEIACELIHDGYDPEQDNDRWRIVGVKFNPGVDQLRIDVFPGRTSLEFDTGCIETLP